MMNQSTTHALALRIDRDAATTLPVQLAEQIRARVRRGELAAGARLPSSRALAEAIGVSRAVAGAAYDQLVAEGWLETRQGAGTYVCAVDVPDVPEHSSRPSAAATLPGAVSLAPGEPWTPSRPSAAWRRAWRAVANAPPPAAYPDPHGLPELRTAIAAHVGRTRGLACTADQVLVTSGTTHGLGLLLSLGAPGRAIAVEDPGYGAAVATARSSGWRVLDVPVDEHGLDAGALDGLSAEAVYATPSHQYPLGVLMPIQRRMELLAWARTRDAYVIEDDYDSEFRYDVAPLPTLAELDPRRVVYLGTVAKTIGAGLRLGWLIGSPGLIERLAVDRRARHDHPPWPTQRALLSLLRDGEWDRTVRAARRRYARRDELVERMLSQYGPLSGVGAGMHTTLLLDPETASTVARDADAAGVIVPTVADTSRSRGCAGGLVIGYGSVSDEQLTFALGVLVDRLRRTVRQ